MNRPGRSFQFSSNQKMKQQLLLTALMICSLVNANAQKAKPEDTEYYSPVPKIVTPGNAAGQAPSDAVVLFDGTSLDQWVATKDSSSPNKWTVADNVMTVNKSNGDIQTKRSFMDFQLHLEYRRGFKEACGFSCKGREGPQGARAGDQDQFHCAGQLCDGTTHY